MKTITIYFDFTMMMMPMECFNHKDADKCFNRKSDVMPTLSSCLDPNPDCSLPFVCSLVTVSGVKRQIFLGGLSS